MRIACRRWFPMRKIISPHQIGWSRMIEGGSMMIEGVQEEIPDAEGQNTFMV
jgi:hypothetical protein